MIHTIHYETTQDSNWLNENVKHRTTQALTPQTAIINQQLQSLSQWYIY